MDDRIPNPPSVAGIPPNIGERLARLESGQEWIKVLLALMGAVMIGGFAFVGVQINRLDAKFDALNTSLSARIEGSNTSLSARIEGSNTSLSARIDAQSAATHQEFAQMRQELVGIANAISSSITATKQVQPQIIVVPTPSPGTPAPPKP